MKSLSDLTDQEAREFSAHFELAKAVKMVIEAAADFTKSLDASDIVEGNRIHRINKSIDVLSTFHKIDRR